MKRSALLVSAVLPPFLLACALDSDSGAGRSASAVVHEDGSTDPMDHLNILGSDAMEGRGTGQPGHQRAAEYVAGECARAGLDAAYPGADKPYFQPFTVGFLPTPPGASPDLDDDDFGIDLFEHALYLNGAASSETKGEMGHQLCGALAAAGERCPPGVEEGTVDPRPVVESAAAPLPTSNVVGFFAGSGPHKDEIVLLSAHLDHLGKTSTGIYPGADDNGSGSAALLAMMHTLAAMRRTHPFDRTIAFLWTSGEEKGLLGSAYFVDNTPPTVPLSRIKLVVNMDMVGRFDDTRFSIGGDSVPTVTAAYAEFDAANQAMDRPFVKINHDIQQYNRRQDGYSFSRRGVPALFVFEGLSNPSGGGSLMANYHKQTDTLANLMADNGGSKERRMAAMMSAAVARIVDQAPPAAH